MKEAFYMILALAVCLQAGAAFLSWRLIRNHGSPPCMVLCLNSDSSYVHTEVHVIFLACR